MRIVRACTMSFRQTFTCCVLQVRCRCLMKVTRYKNTGGRCTWQRSWEGLCWEDRRPEFVSYSAKGLRLSLTELVTNVLFTIIIVIVIVIREWNKTTCREWLLIHPLVDIHIHTYTQTDKTDHFTYSGHSWRPWHFASVRLVMQWAVTLTCGLLFCKRDDLHSYFERVWEMLSPVSEALSR